MVVAHPDGRAHFRAQTIASALNQAPIALLERLAHQQKPFRGIFRSPKAQRETLRRRLIGSHPYDNAPRTSLIGKNPARKRSKVIVIALDAVRRPDAPLRSSRRGQ